MKRSEKPKSVSLNLAQQEKFKEQVVIVLADYRVSEPLRGEAANRIMNNLRIVATMKV